MHTVVVKSVEELAVAAEQFCATINTNKVFLFYGGMGAGKTSFIKEICRQLGVIEEVTSPTFAIVNEYTCTQYPLIYHFDFYRIEKTSEIFDIGFEEYLESGALIFIEWPEMLEELTPAGCAEVHITGQDDSSRVISW